MELPPDDAVRRLASLYAGLVAELEVARGEPLLVLPNSDFFPDRFSHDQAGVEGLVARMQGYAALEDVGIDIALVAGGEEAASAGSCGTGGCGSGACATPSAEAAGPRVEKRGQRWLLRVPAPELGSSIVLTARLATALGAVALCERHPRGSELAADPAQAELAATALGFGVLLLEASYLYSKSCGGPSVKQGTTLACDELAVLLAFSLAREEHSAKAALAELGTTQRAVLKQALAIIDESPGLVRLLRERPERVARGDFRLRDRGSFLARLFGSKKARTEPAEREEAALAALERGASLEELEELVAPLAGSPRAPAAAQREKRERDDELRSLVDEALGEARQAREARPEP